MRAAWILLLGLFVACAPKTPTPESDPFALPGERGSEGPGIVHTFVAGESWESLAEDYYGKPRKADDLRRANSQIRTVPLPGDEVFIPLSTRERQAFQRRAEARAPYNRGLELAGREAYPEAIIQFRAAIGIHKGFAAAHYNLGLVYSRIGQLDLAAEALAKATKHAPGRADYHYARGTVELDRGKERGAEKAFRRALDQDFRHLPSLYALASLLSEQGREKTARPFWRRYLELDPDGLRATEARRHLEGGP